MVRYDSVVLLWIDQRKKSIADQGQRLGAERHFWWSVAQNRVEWRNAQDGFASYWVEIQGDKKSHNRTRRIRSKLELLFSDQILDTGTTTSDLLKIIETGSWVSLVGSLAVSMDDLIAEEAQAEDPPEVITMSHVVSRLWHERNNSQQGSQA